MKSGVYFLFVFFVYCSFRDNILVLSLYVSMATGYKCVLSKLRVVSVSIWEISKSCSAISEKFLEMLICKSAYPKWGTF